MRKNGLHTAALLGAVLTSLLLAACQNEGRWYPGAEVSVQSSYEFAPGPGAKAILVTHIIHNTSSTTIIPGGKVALPVTNSHATADARKTVLCVLNFPEKIEKNY
jgi:hypothetical protein